ncbi:MAG: hypothetical protein AVDCRST_MAG38-2842 [uncultured Solirubrobacteraceae bacterium]|uniref:SPW repeat-containing integral membrane domain-containing protein n=1 Tax=uncultured Solirubrobacteraceae bacterium TaxID=1162706 RepID=A0A6J4SHW5_9ACTN|nr:MAG: hypothetical protein AVDCRST_MAG38-2842 [uncultured Solirubrobacteraceae bacterium]
MLDYPTGLLLIASPLLFGFTDAGTAAVAIPVVLGVMILLQSLVTNYELSLLNLLPLPVHLATDVVGGVVLATTPSLVGFSDEGVNAWLPHVVIGLGLILSGLLTQPHRPGARGWHTVSTDGRGEWPDAQQPGPDGVDVGHTASEAGRPTGTER